MEHRMECVPMGRWLTTLRSPCPTEPLAWRVLPLELSPAMIELRRDLHRNPEVGWTEYRTTRRVAEVLAERGLSPRVRPDGTGLTVEIGSGEPIVGFRADMDALPIQEEGRPEYRSERDGVMHACGHDVHTAVGVGVASALAGSATFRQRSGSSSSLPRSRYRVVP